MPQPERPSAQPATVATSTAPAVQTSTSSIVAPVSASTTTIAAPVAVSTPAVAPPAVAPPVIAPPPVVVAPTSALRLVPLSQWPHFHDDLGTKGLKRAAAKSLAYLKTIDGGRLSYRIGGRELAAGELEASVEEFSRIIDSSKDDAELNARLRENFDLYQSPGSDGQGKMLFTSYYQPILAASPKKTAKYKYPIYKKPKDLIVVDLAQFGRGSGDPLLGRLTPDGRIVPYFDRRDIDVLHVLAGKHLEIAWLADPYDRIDLHIQGSGLLRFPDGRLLRAKYAATNSLPYKSIGVALLSSGAISRSDYSLERLKQYLVDHPEGVDWILAQNPRYTFFELQPVADSEPTGTIQQPLTAGRSIAIDPKIIPLGAIAYFETPMPQADLQGRLLGAYANSRFALCQDSGGAINGAGHVDIYLGHGAQAKAMAVGQHSDGRLFILLKKLPPRDR